MSDSPNVNDLLKSLQSVTTLMQNLLNDIKEHSISLAMVRVKLETMAENVESLSHIVRDGNGKGSMVTRLALAEKELENMEEWNNDLREDINKTISDIKSSLEREVKSIKRSDQDQAKFNRNKTMVRIQIIGASIAGFLALALQIIQIIYK